MVGSAAPHGMGDHRSPKRAMSRELENAGKHNGRPAAWQRIFGYLTGDWNSTAALDPVVQIALEAIYNMFMYGHPIL